jgi:hypothetical protein
MTTKDNNILKLDLRRRPDIAPDLDRQKMTMALYDACRKERLRHVQMFLWAALAGVLSMAAMIAAVLEWG